MPSSIGRVKARGRAETDATMRVDGWCLTTSALLGPYEAGALGRRSEHRPKQLIYG
jgi:hypothetical protein